MGLRHVVEKKRLVLAVGTAVFAAAAFFSYSFLPIFSGTGDNSPDENSNRFFSRLFAETGRLWVFEPIDQMYPGTVHPRSVAVRDSFLVPGGFLGLPLIYGGLAKITGPVTLPFLTAFFAVLGLSGFYLLLKGFFGRPMALISTVLLAVNPVWWYQANRSFMPNTLFVSLLLLAAGFFWGKPIDSLVRRRRTSGFLGDLADALVAGVFLALALAVRPPEAYWIFWAALSLVLAYGLVRQWPRILAVFLAAGLTVLPILLMNRTVYGGFLSSGYGFSPTDVSGGGLPGGMGARLIGPLQPYLFPLGFAPRTALTNFWNFGIGLFSWWWLLVAAAAVAAIFFWARNRNRSGQGVRGGVGWLVAGTVISAWLVAFYGSWTIRDNPDPEAITVGSSYLRYWLPIFVLSVLPVGWGLERVWSSRVRSGRFLAVAAISAIAVISGLSVLFAPQEGLLAIRKNLAESERKAQWVFERVGSRKLTVTDRADKYLWPERPVIYPLRSDSTWEALAHLVPRMGQVHYFGVTFPERDMEWLNTVKLPPLKLRIRLVEGMGDESLYVFEAQPD
ncbi:hypothetical protein JW899_03550 [Candidatus Uhrbacteria bacterium]|nr:hypothetical protein [Candidatus Uhrbacteria bacterium]